MAKQKVIGPWTIVDLINEGGNSWVWRAQRDGQTPIALKVLKSTDPRSEAYRRFVDEVEIMRRLGKRPGIHFILDPRI